jgi:hypothetical protein
MTADRSVRPADAIAGAPGLGKPATAGTMTTTMRAVLLTFLASAIGMLADALPAQQPNAVVRWNDAALAAIRTNRTPPPRVARILAILHTAMFDAVNGIRPEYEHWLVPPTAPAAANRRAAAAQAAHDVLAATYPKQAPDFAQALATELAQLPNNPARQQGIAWGAHVAAAALADRANDGSTEVAIYLGSTAPGMWRPTVSFGGNVLGAMLPAWGNVTPFAVADIGALQPPPPPPLASPEYAAEALLVQALGGATSGLRTAEQTEIARFWAYGPGTASPPGHWNEIATSVVVQRHVGLVESARLYALLNVALADAAIACWRCKYTVGLWRPITAIQLADQDGNPATAADPNWTPLLPTPPFPEYTSGHSTFSGAAAVVLARFFRSDVAPFTAPSDDLPGVTRSYLRFSDAAIESGLSRIYGGIHFPSANVYGLQVGAEVGREVCNRRMRRLRGAGD